MNEFQRNLVEKKMAIGRYLKETRKKDLTSVRINVKRENENNVFEFINSIR